MTLTGRLSHARLYRLQYPPLTTYRELSYTPQLDIPKITRQPLTQNLIGSLTITETLPVYHLFQ